MTEEPKNAQVAHREEIKAAPRPQQLGRDSKDIAEAVQSLETEDTFKVYIKEFLQKFTGTKEECEAQYTKLYEGRVEQEDFKIEQPWSGAKYHVLSLRIWNIAGEFKDKPLADAYAETIPADRGQVSVVGRNSRDEVLLKDYGIKKLSGRASQIARQDA